MGHFGFSIIGLIFLLMLFIPNIIWANKYLNISHKIKENKVLLWFERVGQVLVTTTALIFNDYDFKDISIWIVWLIVAIILMMLYEYCWIRYFKDNNKVDDMYKKFLFIPLPLAILPVMAFLFLGIYGKVIWLVISSIIIAIGHIGIHLQHYQAIKGRN